MLGYSEIKDRGRVVSEVDSKVKEYGSKLQAGLHLFVQTSIRPLMGMTV